MDRNIEIRANAIYPILQEGHPENKIKNAQFHAYIKGATEQRAIDDAERDTAVYNLLQLKLDAEKKLWLEKAREWFSEHIIEYVCYTEMDGWDIRHKEMHEDFRKAMEE